jgi:hypothetical protein
MLLSGVATLLIPLLKDVTGNIHTFQSFTCVKARCTGKFTFTQIRYYAIPRPCSFPSLHRLLPRGRFPPPPTQDPRLMKFYEELKAFALDKNAESYTFPTTLNSYERRQVNNEY